VTGLPGSRVAARPRFHCIFLGGMGGEHHQCKQRLMKGMERPVNEASLLRKRQNLELRKKRLSVSGLMHFRYPLVRFWHFLQTDPLLRSLLEELLLRHPECEAKAKHFVFVHPFRIEAVITETATQCAALAVIS
jgi:hypothetical protein